MTVLYSYQFPEKQLTQQLGWQPHAPFQLNEINSLDEIPRELERPGVVFLNGDNPSCSLILEKIIKAQPVLVPIVLYSQGKVCPADVLEKAEVLFTPVQNAQQVVENRIQRALAFSKLQVYQVNSQLVDEASGLYSYAYYVRRLQDEMALAKRHNTPFSCVVIKFAFYEAYLDSYGYQFIEKLYARLAERIKSVIRQEDIAARLGNDEMALLLPRTPEKGAYTLAKRLMEQVIRLEIGGEQAEDLFVFAGIVEYPSFELADADPDTLLRFTRHALHQARHDETEPIQLFSAMRPSAAADKPPIDMVW